MALLSPGFICSANVARFGASNLSSDIEIQLDAAAAINTAIESYLFTCTLSITSESAIDIQNLTNLLQNLGYTFSISGTTLTINW